MSSSNQPNLARILIILTLFFIFTQAELAWINITVEGLMDVIARIAVTTRIFFFRPVLFPVIHLIFAQLAVYAALVSLLWFVVTSIGELFSFPARTTFLMGILLWLVSVIGILALNAKYVPHSHFTSMTGTRLTVMMVPAISIIFLAAALALINMALNLINKRHLLRDSLVLVFMLALWFGFNSAAFTSHKTTDASTVVKPNIFIISFDAMRPDYLGYFDRQRTGTPNFDHFLQSSIVFTDAYTPLARTLPSWVGILTANYPLHNGIRDNNVLADTASMRETLPERLRQAGYTTIYATDDRRFNNIDQHYGFDHIIGPDGTVADYLIGTFNDFPLGNLLAPTPIGKWLFPYNHANHGSAHTYDPDNFLAQINQAIRRTGKPLFLAVHFDLSAWPFYWFNDKMSYKATELDSYANAISGDDRLLEKFLDLLAQNKLLSHAIVVLMSDHGISLALHGDRNVSLQNYQGNPANIKLLRTKYANTQSPMRKLSDLRGSATVYGIDTSYGYGDDVLSLKQYHPILAFKGYGLSIGKAHAVAGRALLLDIAPTLLDLLHLPAFRQADGMTLKPYFNDAKQRVPERFLFLESGFTPADITQRDIVLAKVVAESINFVQFDKQTGLTSLTRSAIPTLIENKQRAILAGDWLLAYYPQSIRFHYIYDFKQADRNKRLTIDEHTVPAYFVLVNLKTGKWTMEMNEPLVKISPMMSLREQLNLFYGHEMDVYKIVS